MSDSIYIFCSSERDRHLVFSQFLLEIVSSLSIWYLCSPYILLCSNTQQSLTLSRIRDSALIVDLIVLVAIVFSVFRRLGIITSPVDSSDIEPTLSAVIKLHMPTTFQITSGYIYRRPMQVRLVGWLQFSAVRPSKT